MSTSFPVQVTSLLGRGGNCHGYKVIVSDFFLKDHGTVVLEQVF